GIDSAGRVVYLGTFSKTVFPSLRTGYLVVPAALVDAFTAAIRQTGHTVPAAVQAALADFLSEGHFAAHIRRTRARHRAPSRREPAIPPPPPGRRRRRRDVRRRRCRRRNRAAAIGLLPRTR